MTPEENQNPRPVVKNPRALWRPKLREVTTQCASCPFKIGNDGECIEIMQKLRVAHGISGKVTKKDLTYFRIRVRMDIEHTGDFACHHTAYTPEMKLRPVREMRQCKGATTAFKNEK